MTAKPSAGNPESMHQRVKSAGANALARPSFYLVLVHDDPVTPRSFVVEVLKSFFQKPEGEASKILALTRNFGTGVVGKYAFEIAESKAYFGNEYARQAGYPLHFSIEKE
jgi:ATP-dependent Clp protease adaptor protein ClpS